MYREVKLASMLLLISVSYQNATFRNPYIGDFQVMLTDTVGMKTFDCVTPCWRKSEDREVA